MRRLLLLVVVLAAALAAPAAPASADASSASCHFVVPLDPSSEVRPPDSPDPVESVARGFSLLRISHGHVRVTTVIFNPARETFFGGHIHVAPAGQNGPIVVPLFDGMSSAFVLVHADRVPVDDELAAAICGDPAAYYVNYHTTQDPGGAVRGQLG